MDRNEHLHEDMYGDDEGEDAYEGDDVYIEYEPSGRSLAMLLGHDVEDDEDEDDEDFEPDEDDGYELDHQLDAEDALEAAVAELDAEADEAMDEQRERGSTISFGQIFEMIRSQSGDGRGPAIALGQILTSLRSNPGVTDVSALFRGEQAEEPPFTESERKRIRKSRDWWMKAHNEPQEAGASLLHSGEFGRIGPKVQARNLVRSMRERSMSQRPMPKEDICESLVPNSAGSVVAAYPANVYCGQFSADASFYYACCKDFNLHIYDTTVGPRYEKNGRLRLHYDSTNEHSTSMKVHKSIRGIPEGWTITDSHLSHDNERMIYSAMNSTVYMVKTLEYDSTQTPINFAEPRSSRTRGNMWGWDDDTYCIWSCRFSADSNEVIAGGRSKIFVYDLIADRRTVKIPAHEDDVNSCCWADSGSNVLISASDDTFIKVWDRRSLGSSNHPSGVLIGHTQGITNVSAKGDGRYIVSNGKDQALRLWDLRKMRSHSDYIEVKNKHYGLSGFDYRYEDDRIQPREAHPKNCSVMTYRGHTVMRTLIRCHFSPAESTGGSYIYSGSTDGRIHIWSLDGRVVQVLDRAQTLPISFDPSEPDPPPRTSTRRAYASLCVRDVSWHSSQPVMLSAAWGAHGESTVARHEWKGLSKMNYKLEDWTDKAKAEAAERQVILGRPLPGAFHDSDGDEYVATSDEDESE